MPSYIVRRILLMIPTLLGAVTLIFLLMRLLPGDVALYILGSGESSDVNKEALEQIRQDLGLDQPLIVQYGNGSGGQCGWTSGTPTGRASRSLRNSSAAIP